MDSIGSNAVQPQLLVIGVATGARQPCSDAGDARQNAREGRGRLGEGASTIGALELLHLILSHHGELEFGSPKKPALLEAVALHYADNTDAKLESMSEFLSGAANGDWLGYQRLWESNVRRTTPLD